MASAKAPSGRQRQAMLEAEDMKQVFEEEQAFRSLVSHKFLQKKIQDPFWQQLMCLMAEVAGGKESYKRSLARGKEWLTSVQLHTGEFPHLVHSDLYQRYIHELAKFAIVEAEFESRNLQEWDPIALEPPLIIVGLPRTGTTVLHELLALYPNSSVIRRFEAFYPSSLHSPEARTERARKFDSPSPDRPLRADMPEECEEVLRMALHGSAVSDAPLVEDHSEWVRWALQPAVVDRMYRFHRRFLQLLNAQRGGQLPVHWVLKNPSHLLSLRHLLKVYPDARVVWTHRSPADQVRSLASLRNEDPAERRRTALGALSACTGTVSSAIKFRAGFDRESQFLDVMFKDIMERPVETVRKIYEHFGVTRSLSEDARQELEVKQGRLAEEKIRAPRDLALSDWGLSTELINRAFRDYLQRFPQLQGGL